MTCPVLEPGFPITEYAIYFQSIRVHLLSVEDLNLHGLEPEGWGWKFVGKVLKSINTDMQPAPVSVLKFVRCKCNSTSKNVCCTNFCSLRKHVLKCMVACAEVNHVEILRISLMKIYLKETCLISSINI